MRFPTIFAALLFIIAPCRAMAGVADSSSTGFTVKISVTIQAAPADVYRRLVRNVGDWWDPRHTFSGDSRNLSIEEKPMGCFCEKLPDQGAVRHMEVLLLAPGKTLVLSGGLGPLQSMAATGSMTIQLSPAQDGTKLDLAYAVAGYLPAGMNTWAERVDSMLTQQVSRLKNYIEHGDPAPKASGPAER